jgi:hypothetical protein
MSTELPGSQATSFEFRVSRKIVRDPFPSTLREG